MAEEKEGGGEEVGGSVLKKWGPLAAIVLFCQAVIAAGLIHFLGGSLFSQDENGEKVDTVRSGRFSDQVEDKEELLPFYYVNEKLANITANPAGTNGERFVVFDVELGLRGNKKEDGEPLEETVFVEDDFTKKMEKVLPRIKSIITEIMRSKTINHLEGELFKDVKKEMKNRINIEVFNNKKFNEEEAEFTISLDDVNVSRLIIQ